ncbi:MAG: ATP-binding protein, partial [Chloroflexota bacterium]
RQLFQNFLSNAIKFRVRERQPQINIECENILDELTGNELVRIKISDNGVGFDEKFKNKVFVIFQQLHTKKGYAGNGVGLAICKKIVDRHSGQIQVESTPDVGTTFTVTLPLTQEMNLVEGVQNGI